MAPQSETYERNATTRLRAPRTLAPGFPYAAMLATVLVMATLAFLMSYSGAIQTLNDSGLLR